MSFWSKCKELYRARKSQKTSKSLTFEESRHSRTKNLIYAEAAVKYAEEKILLGSTNRSIDEAHWRARSSKLGDSDVRIALREQFRQDVDKSRPLGMSAGADALRWADQAEAFGMGNCGEHANVAFKYLLHHTDAKEVSTLDVGDNHVLLVIGASPSELESARSDRGTFRLDSPPNLPEQAVFCDPWHHEWFPASAWPNKIKSILRQTQVRNPSAMDHMHEEERAMWESAGISLEPREFSDHWREIEINLRASRQQGTIAEYQEYLHRHPDAVAPQRTNRAAIVAAAETRAESIIASAPNSSVKSAQRVYDERPRSGDRSR